MIKKTDLMFLKNALCYLCLASEAFRATSQGLRTAVAVHWFLAYYCYAHPSMGALSLQAQENPLEFDIQSPWGFGDDRMLDRCHGMRCLLL